MTEGKPSWKMGKSTVLSPDKPRLATICDAHFFLNKQLNFEQHERNLSSILVQSSHTKDRSFAPWTKLAQEWPQVLSCSKPHGFDVWYLAFWYFHDLLCTSMIFHVQGLMCLQFPGWKLDTYEPLLCFPEVSKSYKHRWLSHDQGSQILH